MTGQPFQVVIKVTMSPLVPGIESRSSVFLSRCVTHEATVVDTNPQWQNKFIFEHFIHPAGFKRYVEDTSPYHTNGPSYTIVFNMFTKIHHFTCSSTNN